MSTATTAPHNLQAEEVVLGTILTSPSLLEDLTKVAPGSAYYLPAHETILEALHAMREAGAPIEVAAVNTWLAERGLLERVGGAAYLVRLFRQASPQNVNYYARQIADMHTRRQIQHLASTLQNEASVGGTVDTKDILATAQANLDNLGLAVTGQRGVETIGNAFQRWVERIEAGVDGPCVATGWPDLDNHLMGGLFRKQLALVAGRPGSGKTTVATNVAIDIGVRQAGGLPVLMISQEMTSDELVARSLSQLTGIRLKDLKTGELSEHDWAKIAAQEPAVSAARFYVDDAPAQTVAEMKAKATRIKREQGDLGLIIIDHIGLVAPTGRHNNRQEEVTAISKALKVIAKELDVPVMVLAQLNRGPESRDGGVPRVSDLRESGSLEQDADIVLLVHRPDQYVSVEDPDVDTDAFGRGDIIIGKHRDGEQTTVHLNFEGQYSRFTSRARPSLMDPVPESEPAGERWNQASARAVS